jgi:hypothetical protein
VQSCPSTLKLKKEQPIIIATNIPLPACIQPALNYRRSFVDLRTMGHKDRDALRASITGSHHQSCLSILHIMEPIRVQHASHSTYLNFKYTSPPYHYLTSSMDICPIVY